MELINRLEASLMREESYFRSQLLREDIARLKRLQELASKVADETAFKKNGGMIGWTPGDTRSWELKSTLVPFLDAFYASCNDPSAINEGRAISAWSAFDEYRMANLVGCLSRMPTPESE